MHDIAGILDEHRSELSHETVQDSSAGEVDPQVALGVFHILSIDSQPSLFAAISHEHGVSRNDLPFSLVPDLSVSVGAWDE